jgi:hypothetical protein
MQRCRYGGAEVLEVIVQVIVQVPRWYSGGGEQMQVQRWCLGGAEVMPRCWRVSAEVVPRWCRVQSAEVVQRCCRSDAKKVAQRWRRVQRCRYGGAKVLSKCRGGAECRGGIEVVQR